MEDGKGSRDRRVRAGKISEGRAKPTQGQIHEPPAVISVQIRTDEENDKMSRSRVRTNLQTYPAHPHDRGV